MLNILIDKKSFEENERNCWSYNIDLMEEEWDNIDDELINEEAEKILEKHGVIVLDDEEYEKLSDEEKEEDEKYFLKIMYEQFEDFIIEHIAFLLNKIMNITDDSYFYICFNIIAKNIDNLTALEKLYEWKNKALNHKYIVDQTIKTIFEYFEEYHSNDNYREQIEQITYYKLNWENVITYFINEIIKRIDECHEGKRYELYN